ncbi:PREDICTED: uncharacterized protein LOC105557958 isoform X2 [Vollenhovia emeryi]|uniref:uncharacterized protein LOC105557958 isoform X2 n=1 Tax=Vollenhovia emeryi TaxID=411798 RepID=UPI0005F4D692|nr:PREDICTED: uncharacterized protein LOC105557958 isoform X2 [Vollenhovia emeryi]XP_011860787.1 PREDICTED: uncharacterized protein LOC105557958 isoform X2 [Vollenhovia emeryi]
MRNIKRLQKYIQNNWSILADDREINIMYKYTNIGKQSTIVIATCVYFGIIGFTMVQYIPDLLDFVMPLNESRPRILLHQAKNFIDHQKYFHILIIHDVIGILLVGTTGIAAESFSLVNAIHAFGMFKIASYRMERMLSIDVSQISIAKSYIIFHDRLSAAVDIHRRALKFSDLLKVSLGPSYLLMMVTAICSAIVSFFRLFRIVTLHQEKMEIIKLICYVIFLFLFIVIGNFVGQEFINHDEHVHHTMYVMYLIYPFTTRNIASKICTYLYRFYIKIW